MKKNSKRPLSSLMHRPLPRIFYYFLIGIIFFIGIVYRAPEVASRNFLFGYDQGIYYEMVRDIVDGHKLRLIGTEASLGSGMSSVFHGPGFYYLLAIPYILFHGDPYGGMILMFVCGLVTIVMTFLLAKEVFGDLGGLVGLLLMSISPPIVSQSRFIWGPHPITVLVLFLFWCILKAKRNPSLFLPIAVAVSAFVYNFHLAVMVPLIMSVFLYSIFILKIRKVSVYLYSILALCIVTIPAILFDIRHGFRGALGILTFFQSFGRPIPVTENTRIYSFVGHIRDYWNNVLNTFVASGGTSNPHLRNFNIIATVFLVWIGLRNTVDKNIKAFIYYFILLIGVTWGSFLLLNNTIWDYYLLPLHVVYCLLTAYAIASIRFLKPKIRVCIWVYIGALSVYITMLFAQVFVNSWNTEYHDYGGTAKIKGRIEAVDYIYKDANGKPFTTLIFAPPVYTYAFDYVFAWYGKKTYGFIPENKKSEFTYLLIEPDGEKPWSYKGWLETVVKDGTIISTVTLPSGFIVEKRSFP